MRGLIFCLRRRYIGFWGGVTPRWPRSSFTFSHRRLSAWRAEQVRGRLDTLINLERQKDIQPHRMDNLVVARGRLPRVHVHACAHKHTHVHMVRTTTPLYVDRTSETKSQRISIKICAGPSWRRAQGCWSDADPRRVLQKTGYKPWSALNFPALESLFEIRSLRCRAGWSHVRRRHPERPRPAAGEGLGRLRSWLPFPPNLI